MRLVIVCLFLSLFYPVHAYQINVSVATFPNTPVFLAGYYGDRVFVADSALADASGKAVFTSDHDLCPGIYAIVIPGKLNYDILVNNGQTLDIRFNGTAEATINGDACTSAYAGYSTWLNTKPSKQQAVERREQLIGQYPNSFLAVYLAAQQPVEIEETSATGDISQMLKTYQYRRRHFFDRMNLSDVRLLHTPLYHETLQYYISKFVTQQTDTLIHIAYRILELSSENYETFFFVSDFLIDYSLRSKIDNVNRLHNFLQRSRYMLGSKAIPLLPAKSRGMHFLVKDENLLVGKIMSMSFTDTEGVKFDQSSVKSKYRIFYFWDPGCPRCLSNVPAWQSVLNKYKSKSCFGIAVNTNGNVQQIEKRILSYEPLCVNVSLNHMQECERIFFADSYSKIIVTNISGDIIGIFGSAAALDNFLSLI